MLIKTDSYKEEFYLEELYRTGIYFDKAQGANQYTFLDHQNSNQKFFKVESIHELYIANVNDGLQENQLLLNLKGEKSEKENIENDKDLGLKN